MTMEFTITDIRDIEYIENAFDIAGQSAKGEVFKLYMAELHGRPMGGVVRIENAEGAGFEVGRVSFTVGSFPRPILVLTTFNSDVELIGKVLTLLADDSKMSDLVWKRRMDNLKK